MSFYMPGPSVPTVYAKGNSFTPGNLDQLGRLALSPTTDSRPRLASDAGTGEGSIRSTRAGSIASNQTGSTGSYTARALQEQQQLMANRIMMGGSSWDSAEDVIVSLKFLQPFVKAGETDAMASQPDSRRPSTTASGGDFAFTHPNPFSTGTEEPPRTANSMATSITSKRSVASSSSGSLTAMESEVYGILKTYVDNKLKKKRGGREKRLVEVGKKVEVLEDQFPDCVTYVRLFKRVRELHGLPTRESTLSVESSKHDHEQTPAPIDQSRNYTSSSFIDPLDSLPRMAPRNVYRDTTSTASSALSRQVSPARSISLGAVPHRARKLSISGHQSKPSTGSYSSQSSFSPSITADDIFVNFGLNEVEQQPLASNTAGVKGGRRPSTSLFSTSTSGSGSGAGGPEVAEPEITWPLPSPTTGGNMTDEQRQAEMVKAKIAEAFLDGTPGQVGRERSGWVSGRAGRPVVPADIPRVRKQEAEPTRFKTEHQKNHHPEELTSSRAINIKTKASNKALRTMASASTIRIAEPISDTFEADIFGSSPDRPSPSLLDRRRESTRTDARSTRLVGKSAAPPPKAPLPAVPRPNAQDEQDRVPLARSRSNSTSSEQGQARRQAMFMPDEPYAANEIEELQSSESSSISDNSNGPGTGRQARSAEEIMSALQARTSATSLPGTPSKEQLRPAPFQTHSSWSRGSAGRLCDLPEEGEEPESASPGSKTRAYTDDDMMSPAFSTGNRDSTDSWDVNITTPEGDLSFESQDPSHFDAESGMSPNYLEQGLFFRAPAAKRDSAALGSSWK